MDILSRFILTVYAFFVTVWSVIAMLVTLRPAVFERIVCFLARYVVRYGRYTLLFFVIELFFFCTGVVFMLSGLKNSKRKSAIVRDTPLGQVKISLDTIESIVLGTIRKMPFVRESKVYVENREGKLFIIIKIRFICNVSFFFCKFYATIFLTVLMASSIFSMGKSMCSDNSRAEGLRSFSCSNLLATRFILFIEPTWFSGNLTIRHCSAMACSMLCLIHHTA